MAKIREKQTPKSTLTKEYKEKEEEEGQEGDKNLRSVRTPK